jgi:hypothetical protein
VPALPAPSPAQYPALSSFLSGYLHEDFALEHQTPAGALAAFLEDASAEERRALRDEWTRFQSATGRLAWADMRRVFCGLGGAWRPSSCLELKGVFEAL